MSILLDLQSTQLDPVFACLSCNQLLIEDWDGKTYLQKLLKFSFTFSSHSLAISIQFKLQAQPKEWHFKQIILRVINWTEMAYFDNFIEEVNIQNRRNNASAKSLNQMCTCDEKESNAAIQDAFKSQELCKFWTGLHENWYSNRILITVSQERINTLKHETIQKLPGFSPFRTALSAGSTP